MTIDSAYWPEKRNNHGGTVYQFGFEIIDPAYIEVYAIDADDVYTLIDPANYDVTIGTFIAPISRGGRVTFDDPLDADVVAISIQRKSDISDEQEFTTGQPFNAESFEFQCDKLTMILQEINASVCDCSTILKRYCDTYACDAFVDKLGEIFDNVYPFTGGVPGNVGKNPAAGLSVFGSPSYGLTSIMSGVCGGVTCASCNGGVGWKNSSSPTNATYVGSFGGQIKTDNPTSVGLMSFDLNLYRRVRIGFNSATGLMYAQLATLYFENMGPEITLSSSPSTSHFYIVNFSVNSSTNYYEIEAWVDFNYLGVFAGTIDNDEDLNLGATQFAIGGGGGTGNARVQNCFWNPSGVVTAAGVAALQYAYSRNNPAFVDPDPLCIPPP